MMQPYETSSRLKRPKTAGPGTFQFKGGNLPAATVGRPRQRPGSQMSLRSAEMREAADGDSCPQFVPIRRVPSAMKRNMEIQTDPSSQLEARPPAMGTSSGQGPIPLSGGALFYPYYVPGMQDGAESQPYVLLSPWQLPGYQNLPVLDPNQMMLLGGPGRLRTPSVPHPLDGAPIYRSGRNGSCWRHIRQCTGNLGNNIMFVDGHVKEEDCRRFPPHGYVGASTAGLSVHSRLAPKSAPRAAAGVNHSTLALERAKTGTKYWFEDKKPATLTPNTIQGRMMKSGAAY